MASMRITGTEDIEKMFRMLSDPTNMAIEAVNEAAPILERNLKDEIMSSAEHPTGDLAGHIETLKARENEYGVFAVVKPADGKDSDGVEYEDRMRYFDVGFRDKSGEWHKGKGVRQRAVNRSEEEIKKKYENKVDQFIEKAMR